MHHHGDSSQHITFTFGSCFFFELGALGRHQDDDCLEKLSKVATHCFRLSVQSVGNKRPAVFPSFTLTSPLPLLRGPFILIVLSTMSFANGTPPAQDMSAPPPGGPGPDQPKTTLWMGELEPWMDENFIKGVFLSAAGETVNVKVIRDKNSG